ncbi:Uncharacterized protein APZ42_012607 [Daphnia magna]|uniref:THAP-type domain-containing protein n=1 Tax=Daphnia magna TaxID=35525 RepID=A0A162RP37_9CRUS|nr:Uncharacterized protein APZ42_012607 [Daphnia magna]
MVSDIKICKTSYICSDHFEEICFDRIRRLKTGAVPTIFHKPIPVVLENSYPSSHENYTANRLPVLANSYPIRSRLANKRPGNGQTSELQDNSDGPSHCEKWVEVVEPSPLCNALSQVLLTYVLYNGVGDDRPL